MAEEPMSAPEAPAPGPAPAPTPSDGWQAPAPTPSDGWQAPAPPKVPGIPGLVYADVPNRIIALIIDSIILGIIGFVVAAVLGSIVGLPYSVNLDFNNGDVGISTNYLSVVVILAATLAVNAAYWIYSWTVLRGSPGMKVLGMQVGNYPDGKTLTQNQAIRRWVALGGPLPLAQALNGLPLLGMLISLAVLGYFIYLLYTTSQSPTKQGWHDKFANSVVVKASRTV